MSFTKRGGHSKGSKADHINKETSQWQYRMKEAYNDSDESHSWIDLPYTGEPVEFHEKFEYRIKPLKDDLNENEDRDRE